MFVISSLNIVIYVIIYTYHKVNGANHTNKSIANCPLREYCKSDHSSVGIVTCSNFSNFSRLNFESSQNCTWTTKCVELNFESNGLILDSSLNLSSLFGHLERPANDERIRIQFEHLRGFELSAPMSHSNQTTKYGSSKFTIYVDKSNFTFFHNGKPLDCESSSSIFSSIFNSLSNADFVLYATNDFSRHLCPSIFANSQIDQLHLVGMSNASTNRNYLKFDNNKHTHGIGAQISVLVIEKCVNLSLNEEILNERVFGSLRSIEIYSELVSIGQNLLAPLRHLRKIVISMQHMRSFFNRGLRWLLDMNADLEADPADLNELIKMRDRIITVELYSELTLDVIFPDEDFCTYAELTFRNLVNVVFGFPVNDSTNNVIYNYLTRYSDYFKIALSNSLPNSDISSVETHLNGLYEAKEERFQFFDRSYDCVNSTYVLATTNQSTYSMSPATTPITTTTQTNTFTKFSSTSIVSTNDCSLSKQHFFPYLFLVICYLVVNI